MKGTGCQYDYGFRTYDPRIGRFLSIDPKAASFPYYSPFQYAGNKPIVAIDLDGLEDVWFHTIVWSNNAVSTFEVYDGDEQLVQLQKQFLRDLGIDLSNLNGGSLNTVVRQQSDGTFFISGITYIPSINIKATYSTAEQFEMAALEFWSQVSDAPGKVDKWLKQHGHIGDWDGPGIIGSSSLTAKLEGSAVYGLFTGSIEIGFYGSGENDIGFTFSGSVGVKGEVSLSETGVQMLTGVDFYSINGKAGITAYDVNAFRVEGANTSVTTGNKTSGAVTSGPIIIEVGSQTDFSSGKSKNSAFFGIGFGNKSKASNKTETKYNFNYNSGTKELSR